MAQLYKADYRRYMVQLPVKLADEVDEIAKAETKSASQVIVEHLNKGMFGAGIYTPAEIKQWSDDELAMLRAARLALDAIHGPQEEREIRLQSLVKHVIEAGLRKSKSPIYSEREDDKLKAAEHTPPTEGEPPPKLTRTTGAGPRHRVSKSA